MALPNISAVSFGSCNQRGGTINLYIISMETVDIRMTLYYSIIQYCVDFARNYRTIYGSVHKIHINGFTSNEQFARIIHFSSRIRGKACVMATMFCRNIFEHQQRKKFVILDGNLFLQA